MNIKELKYKIENDENFKIDEKLKKFFLISLYDLQQAIQNVYPDLQIIDANYFDEEAICTKHEFYLTNSSNTYRYPILYTRTGYEDDIFLACCEDKNKLKFFILDLLANNTKYDNNYLFVNCKNQNSEMPRVMQDYPELNAILWGLIYNKIKRTIEKEKDNYNAKINYVQSNPIIHNFQDDVNYRIMKNLLPEYKKRLSALKDVEDTDLSLI